MTNQEIKAMFSKEVLSRLKYDDISTEMCLRSILFCQKIKLIGKMRIEWHYIICQN